MCTYHEYYGEHIVCDFPMSQQQHYIQCTVSVTLSYSTVAMVLKKHRLCGTLQFLAHGFWMIQTMHVQSSSAYKIARRSAWKAVIKIVWHFFVKLSSIKYHENHLRYFQRTCRLKSALRLVDHSFRNMWGPEKDRTDVVKAMEVDDVANSGALAPEHKD